MAGKILCIFSAKLECAQTGCCKLMKKFMAQLLGCNAFVASLPKFVISNFQ
jgi:hypothetical protein